MRSPVQANAVDNEPEEGEIGGASPAQSTSSRHKRRSSSAEDEDRASSRKKHRNNSSETPSKKEKRKKEHRRNDQPKTDSETSAVVANAVEDAAPLPLLSTDECNEKWKPNKKLREIRQVLKKMKIMADWSRNQKDETVVEKVFKYVSTIGEEIDRIVTQHQDKEERHHSDASSREIDELCTCLWTYAAGFTPFTAQGFERLYDDICADGDALVAARS
ncbi:Glutathione reductase [Phytophthora cinnamomi]|nr:Glutathione reductase [Phytophthora cinnamomi]